MSADFTATHLLPRDKSKSLEMSFSHPWNPQSQLSGVPLGKVLGLQRIGVSLVHIAPGKESFVYHSHLREEEWIYILQGRGMADIDGKEYEVGAGDFMAFPTPSVAHHLRNPFSEVLTYLMGGENLDMEIAEFPRLGKRTVRTKDKIDVYDIGQAQAFGPLK